MLELPLSIKQYAERFRLVLHLEEIQMEEDIKKYDLYHQTMKRDKTNKDLLVLQVSANSFIPPKIRCNWYNIIFSEIYLFKYLFMCSVYLVPF